MTDSANPQRIVLEGGTMDGRELRRAASPLITSDAGEEYEMLTDQQGNPEHDILRRLRYRLVWVAP